MEVNTKAIDIVFCKNLHILAMSGYTINSLTLILQTALIKEKIIFPFITNHKSSFYDLLSERRTPLISGQKIFP